MITALENYFEAFKNSAKEEDGKKLGYFELMGVSWALHMLYAFYSVFALYLGVRTYDYFSQSKDFTHLILESFNFKFQKISLLTTLFSVILYPFIFQFAYRFWKGVFKFYANIFDYEDEQFNEKSEDILRSAFSANLFLIFPIIGNVLSNIALAFFIFSGLKRKYEFTSLQAGLVLITPLFIVFLISVFTASYFTFLFSLL